MTYEVIATGSDGNAVVIENSILVDCGVSFKKLAGVWRGLKLVLLTHIHQDHFNRATVRRLSKERPTLRWGCCEWMVGPLVECGVEKRNISVCDFGHGFAYIEMERGRSTTSVTYAPFQLYHDVPNCGWEICYNSTLYLYATDTSRIDVEAKDYDLYLIEANWEEAEIEQRIEKQIIDGADYIHEYKAMQNHLSHADAMDFIAKNAGGKSRYELLHGHKEDKDV